MGIRVCWRPSPLSSHRVLDRSMGINWFLADEITAELSLLKLFNNLTVITLWARSHSLLSHFISSVLSEMSILICMPVPPPCSDAIMLLFSPLCWKWVPQKLPCMHASSLAQASLDPGHHTVVCLFAEVILHCTDPLWCQEWTSRLVWMLLSP